MNWAKKKNIFKGDQKLLHEREWTKQTDRADYSVVKEKEESQHSTIHYSNRLCLHSSIVKQLILQEEIVLNKNTKSPEKIIVLEFIWKGRKDQKKAFEFNFDRKIKATNKKYKITQNLSGISHEFCSQKLV